MKDILDEINAVVGVRGSFLCDEEGAVVRSAMPETYDPAELAAVGRVLTQTMAGLVLARRRKVRDIDLVYRQARLVAKNTGNGCLCILGSPDLNVAFLNLTADLAIRELKQASKQAPLAAPAEAVPAEVPPAPRPAIQTLIEFLELLLQELEGHGIGRQDLVKILSHRLRKLGESYPFLGSLVSADDRLDPASLPLDSVEPKTMAEGLAALIHGLCFSLRGMMGEEKAEEAYIGVYDAFYAEHRADFVTLGLGDRLRKIVHQPLPSAHSGVDIHLD